MFLFLYGFLLIAGIKITKNKQVKPICQINAKKQFNLLQVALNKFLGTVVLISFVMSVSVNFEKAVNQANIYETRN